MRSNRFHVVTAVWAIFTAILLMDAPSASAGELVLHSFSGIGVDGDYPQGTLVADAAGNLYGTTSNGPSPNGGASGCGVVFELSVTGGVWAEKILHTFLGGADGCNPQYESLTFDAAENLYGTTVDGGAYNLGTAFKLQRAAGWKETILHSFGNGPDGSNPHSTLTFDAAGNLYGTTGDQATTFAGHVFELRAGTWTENILSSSCGCGFSGQVVFDKAGNLYTTSATLDSILKLTPNGNGTWTSTYVYTFTGNQFPVGDLIFDAAGNLYGITEYGGASGWGVAYRLSPAGGVWTETVLYTFKGPVAGGDGAYPFGGLIFDAYGSLYGTTSEGGTNGSYGTVFELTPAAPQWKETVLYNFGGFAGDVTGPYGSLIFVGGNLYGTGFEGGADGVGGVFEIVR